MAGTIPILYIQQQITYQTQCSLSLSMPPIVHPGSIVSAVHIWPALGVSGSNPKLVCIASPSFFWESFTNHISNCVLLVLVDASRLTFWFHSLCCTHMACTGCVRLQPQAGRNCSPSFFWELTNHSLKCSVCHPCATHICKHC